jgi:hypothetical protein
MRKAGGLAIVALFVIAGCSGANSGSAQSGGAGGTKAAGQAGGAATGSITIDGKRHDFTGGTCHDYRPTEATSDFTIMFYPPNGDYMDVAFTNSSVTMVAGNIGGITFDVNHPVGEMRADHTGIFSGNEALSGHYATGTFACP